MDDSEEKKFDDLYINDPNLIDKDDDDDDTINNLKTNNTLIPQDKIDDFLEGWLKIYNASHDIVLKLNLICQMLKKTDNLTDNDNDAYNKKKNDPKWVIERFQDNMCYCARILLQFRAQNKVPSISMQFNNYINLNDQQPQNMKLSEKMINVILTIKNSRNFILSGIDVGNHRISDDLFKHWDSINVVISTKIPDKNKPLELFTQKMLRHNYKIYKGLIYKQKAIHYNKKIVNTYTWEMIHSNPQMATIEQFINDNYQEFQCTPFDIGYRTFMGNITSRITNAEIKVLPKLKMLRHAWSFNNGIYIGDFEELTHMSDDQKCFEQYAYEGMPSEDKLNVIKNAGSFYPYDHPELKTIMGGFSVKKYFDVKFRVKEALKQYYGSANKDWTNLQTPQFDSILDDQKLTARVKKVINIMIGRLFYDVNQKDHWEMLLFFKGIAGSGKSTILKIIKHFFQEKEVGFLSTNHEETFGLQPLVGKKLIMCYELKESLKLSAALLQQMISGEDVNVPIKNKEALHLQWAAQLVFAGNNAGNWAKGAEGSMDRRLMVVEFLHQVVKMDPGLVKRIITKEADFLVLKWMASYQTVVNTYGDTQKIVDYDFYPKIYFKNTVNKLMCEINSVMAFLYYCEDICVCNLKNYKSEESGDDDKKQDIINDFDNPCNDTFMLEPVFYQIYNDFCHQRNKRPETWNNNLYHILGKFGITKKKVCIVNIETNQDVEVDAFKGIHKKIRKKIN